MDLNATNRQLLLQFLKTTGGVITRVLDFWFGVWDPEARAMFRSIYRGSPEFARLPPTDKGHEETYCLRVTVCNRPTDEHRDHLDIKRDMTGLMQIEEFEGAAMCINKLGIALEGYKDGAVLLFRGTNMYHYISQWTGDCRYAFDHTTHQSVKAMVEHHRANKVWRDRNLIRDDNDPNEAKIKKKAANKPKRKAEGSGEEGGELEEEVERRRKRVTKAKAAVTIEAVEESNEVEEEEPSEAKKPKKNPTKAKTAVAKTTEETKKRAEGSDEKEEEETLDATKAPKKSSTRAKAAAPPTTRKTRNQGKQNVHYAIG